MINTFINKQRVLQLRQVVNLVPKVDSIWEAWTGPECRRIRGESVDLVIPPILENCDGVIDVATVIDRVAIATGISPELIHEAIDLLYQWEILDEVDPHKLSMSMSDKYQYQDQIRYFAMNSSHPYRMQHRLANAHVAVVGDSLLGHCIAESLTRSGIRNVVMVPKGGYREKIENMGALTRTPEDELDESRPPRLAVEHQEDIRSREPDQIPLANLVILATRSIFSEFDLECNQICIARSTPLLVLGFSAMGGFVGPCVIPGETACLECLRQRMLAFDANAYNLASIGVDRPSAMLIPIASLLAELTTIEAIKCLSKFAPSTAIDRQLLIATNPLTLTWSNVLKVARCPACGTIRNHAPAAAFDPQGRVP